MVKPKYSPEEALQRVKLMMKYDSSKTLNENKLLIEQADISGDIRDIKDEVSSFLNADEDEIIKIIQKYKTADEFNKLAAAWKDKYGTDFGTAIYSVINSNDPTESKQLKDHLASIGITATAQSTGDGRGTFMWAFSGGNASKTGAKTDTKTDTKQDGTNKKTSSYTPCSPGKYVRGCKSDVVKKVQACLGQEPKYQTGNFGPITQGNLKKLGKGFENGFTDADVEIICQTQTKGETKPETGQEIKSIDSTDMNF